MIALEIIHFYLNVLISKSVIIFTLASQCHIFLFPVLYSFFLLISSLLVNKGPLPLHAWQLISTGHLRALFTKATHIQPTPLPAYWWFFFLLLLFL